MCEWGPAVALGLWHVAVWGQGPALPTALGAVPGQPQQWPWGGQRLMSVSSSTATPKAATAPPVCTGTVPRAALGMLHERPQLRSHPVSPAALPSCLHLPTKRQEPSKPPKATIETPELRSALGGLQPLERSAALGLQRSPQVSGWLIPSVDRPGPGRPCPDQKAAGLQWSACRKCRHANHAAGCIWHQGRVITVIAEGIDSLPLLSWLRQPRRLKRGRVSAKCYGVKPFSIQKFCFSWLISYHSPPPVLWVEICHACS